MATFTFDLVSPETQLFHGPVDQVVVPGADGDFGVLAGHAPFVAALRPGFLTIHAGGSPKRMYVRGGFAEISGGALTVLAEEAVAVEDLDSGIIDAAIKANEDDLAAAKDDAAKLKASERIDQLKAVKAMLGSVRSTH